MSTAPSLIIFRGQTLRAYGKGVECEVDHDDICRVFGVEPAKTKAARLDQIRGLQTAHPTELADLGRCAIAQTKPSFQFVDPWPSFAESEQH